MPIIQFLKRIYLFSILLFAANIYSQETIIPLVEGGWVGGLSGNISWDNFESSAYSNDENYNATSDGFGFSLSSRNGRFIQNNLSMGFDIQWSQNELTTTLDDGLKDSEKTKFGFIGLWSRYYIPFIGTGWAVFSEASLGYGISHTNRANEIYKLKDYSADGFVYNIGIGSTMFVSNNIAFEITGRYQGGKLTGDINTQNFYSDNLEIELSNIDILFGIMIYIK